MHDIKIYKRFSFNKKRPALYKIGMLVLVLSGFLIDFKDGVWAADINVADCVEPYCTYAPPKMTGEEMAAATAKLLDVGSRKYWLGISDIRGSKPTFSDPEIIKDFLSGKDFKFLSPVSIIDNIHDAGLSDLLRPQCLNYITNASNYVLGITGAPSGDKSPAGPFYIYNVRLNNTSKSDHRAAFVYGLDTNPYKEYTVGEFMIVDSGAKCETLYAMHIPGFAISRRSRQYFPTFSGLGYYKGELFVYLVNNDFIIPSPAPGLASKPIQSYHMYWYWGLKPELKGFVNFDGKQFKHGGRVSIRQIPETFDPFSLLIRKQPK